MRKTLVNGLGQSFESRTIKSTDENEQAFLYIHNFKKIDKRIIKNEIKVYKTNAEKSKAAKINYKIWLASDMKLRKIYENTVHTAEMKLIRKNLLKIEIGIDYPVKSILNETMKNIIQEFNVYYKKISENISLISKELTKKTLLKQKAQDKSESALFVSEISKLETERNNIIVNFKSESEIFVNKFNSLESVEQKVTVDTKKEADLANKNLKEDLKDNVKSMSEKSKNNIKIFEDIENLSLTDKVLFNINMNAKRLEFSKVVKNSLKNSHKYSFELAYKYNKACTYVEHEQKLINLKIENAKKISQLISEVKSAKKETKASVFVLKDLKKTIFSERKKRWDDKKNELKAGEASKRAKQVEKKKIYNHFSVKWRNAKLKNNKFLFALNNLKSFRSRARNKIQLEIKIRENALRDVLLQTPVERTRTMFWMGIVSGSIFPGIGSLFVKKYTKGIIQMISTVFALIIIAWIFGAFPSHIGNGLMGLKTIGYDVKTATSNAIGYTGGIANDGRFYLVVGTVAMIMLVVVIMYWIISILDNINQANTSRLGMRPSNWKDQKKLLKTQGLPYLLSFPAMLFIIFIVLLPLIATALISFTDFGQKNWNPDLKHWETANGVTNKISWVGGLQFKTIFVVMGPEFRSVLVWTLIWTFGATLTTLIIGTFFAIIVNQNRIKFKTLFRIIYILPWAIPAFITILYFSIFFSHNGPFNKFFGIDTDWSQAGGKTKILMIFMQGWLGHSYIFLLITGMLQSIPKPLYEAARIDGSSSLRQFSTITAPIIISKIAPLLIGQFVHNFKNFGLIYLFNKGGIIQTPGGTAGQQDIFISWIYKLVNGDSSRPGAAAAMSLFISVFTVTPSAIMFVRSKSFKGGV